MEESVVEFINCDDNDQLPVPVLSNTHPANAQKCLTHVILSLGNYKTELEALTHLISKDCLQEVGLIGNATDQESLKKYSGQLAKKYIENQLVYYPNSLSRAETFIVMAKRVFDDAIIHNAL